MTKATSFQTDIRPLFTQRDIDGMRKGFNLESYDEVKNHAAAIYDRIRESAARSCRPHRQEVRVPGRNLALNCSPSGSPTDYNLSRPAGSRRPRRQPA